MKRADARPSLGNDLAGPEGPASKVIRAIF